MIVGLPGPFKTRDPVVGCFDHRPQVLKDHEQDRMRLNGSGMVTDSQTSR